ncbi:MAG: hypothetical protein QXK76_02210 [Candidatus Woesearchaeota archaeon]
MNIELLLNNAGKNITEDFLLSLGLKKSDDNDIKKIMHNILTTREPLTSKNLSINSEKYTGITIDDIIIYNNDKYAYGFLKIKPSSTNYFLKKAYKKDDKIIEEDITLLGFTGYRILL